MATFTKVGYLAKSKKDPNKRNLVMEKDGIKTYFFLKTKPTEEEVAANPKLEKIAAQWPDWKIADVLYVQD